MRSLHARGATPTPRDAVPHRGRLKPALPKPRSSLGLVPGEALRRAGGAGGVRARWANGTRVKRLLRRLARVMLLPSMHRAAAWDDARLATRLVAQGHGVDERDGAGLTPLHVAAREGSVGMVEWLLCRGADPQAQAPNGSNPLHYAALPGGYPAIVPLLRAGLPVDSRDLTGSTPLHVAATTDALEGVRTLLSAGADVHARDEDGQTPLHLAAEALGDLPETALALLSAGADVNARAKDRSTPLHAAARMGNRRVIEALLAAGASRRVHDAAHITPQEHAAAGGHGRAALLLAHERRPDSWWYRLKTREFWTTPLEPPARRTWVDAVLYLAVAVLVWVAAVREAGCGWR